MSGPTAGTPVLARTRAELDEMLARGGSETRAAPAAQPAGGRLALVPTMGALHEGHASLIREAADRGRTVVSIFVNPLQFGPGEDLDRYPRSLGADLAVCADSGADVVFAPSVEEVYPGGRPQVTVEPGPLGAILEGGSRPTHFRGVLTVVAKLFGLVRPDVAVFGEKDYQQLVLIRRMAADLCMGIDVVGGVLVREPDGLALSSRNRYLAAAERERALALSRALRAGAEAGAGGAREVLAAARVVLEKGDVEPDYLELTGPDLDAPPQRGAARLLVAARLGQTRLIDNAPVELG